MRNIIFNLYIIAIIIYILFMMKVILVITTPIKLIDVTTLQQLKIYYRVALIKLHLRKPSYCDNCTLLHYSKITCRWPSTRTVKTAYGRKEEKFYESVKKKNVYNTCTDFTPIQNKEYA
jgi:hypothetical protein